MGWNCPIRSPSHPSCGRCWRRSPIRASRVGCATAWSWCWLRPCARWPPGCARSWRSPNGSPTCPLPWPSIWAPRSAARASRRSAGWCRTSTPIGSTPPSPPSSSNGAPRSRPRAGCARWPSMRRQLAGLPWREVEPAHRSAETVHGRREIRTTRVVTIAAGIAFPHAAQAVQIVRRTRPVSARTGKAGRWRTETVYAITDLRPAPGKPGRPGRMGPRALADRECPALGPGRDIRRGPVPGPHRLCPAGHGLAAQPRDQLAPPRRRHQHRRRTTPSRPRRQPTTQTTQDHLTLPTPASRGGCTAGTALWLLTADVSRAWWVLACGMSGWCGL